MFPQQLTWMRCFRRYPSSRGPCVCWPSQNTPLNSLSSVITNLGDLGEIRHTKDTRQAALEIVCEVVETADLPRVWSGLALLGLGRTRPTLTTMPHEDWPRQALLSASGSWAPTPTARGFAKGKTQIGLNLIFCLRLYAFIIAHLCPPYLYN